MAIYDKPVHHLMRDMVKDLALLKGDHISKDEVLSWFQANYPRIKQGTITAHLIRMSTNATSRHHYNPKPGEDDLFYQLNGSTFRLYDNETDPSPLQKGNLEADKSDLDVSVDEDDTTDYQEFAYEHDLQNFLSHNLCLIEEGLRLFEDDGITGIEFPAGGRYIDILALDRNNNYVVIELKVSRGYDRVVGQLLRYISWIKKFQADNSQSVRGIIVAREIADDLALACEGLDIVQLYEYQLSITLRKVE